MAMDRADMAMEQAIRHLKPCEFRLNLYILHMHTCIHTYIYIYMYVYVCM